MPIIHTTRKHLQLRVPVPTSEAEDIKQLAASAGLPVVSYLRAVGLGYRVNGILDHKCVEDLVGMNGDLGRLGGLLKLWLTDDKRTAAVGGATIREVLRKIDGEAIHMEGTTDFRDSCTCRGQRWHTRPIRRARS